MKIPIVDENDNIIEHRERDNTDLNAIYRVSSLWVTDADGKILLARRAFNKIQHPGKWGPAVAGTVEEGETYEQNIIKEAEEEIGLKDIKPVFGIKKRRKGKYNYFNQKFLLTLPAGFNDFKVAKDEVAEIKWFSKEELKKELKENPDEFLKGIHERMMEPKKHIVIFSHGFGVKKDSRGFFTDISSSLKDIETVMFNYNEIDKEKKEIRVKQFSKQVVILKDIIENTKSSNPDSVIDIVCHSQGSIIAALAKPFGIRKIILIAPSFDKDIDRMLNIFKSRPGTVINMDGISKLDRADGSTTIIPPEYWTERKDIPNPVDLYNELAKQTALIIINANQDEVLGEVDSSKLENTEVINIDGDHNFKNEYRKKLLEILEDKLKIPSNLESCES